MPALEANLPAMVDARTANVRAVDQLGFFDSLFGSLLNPLIQTALQKLLEFGVPIAAQLMIGSMSYKLGGSQTPIETTFAKSSQWAVALVIVMTVFCVVVTALVAVAIVIERRQERRAKNLSGSESSEDDDERPRRSRAEEAYESRSERHGSSSYSDDSCSDSKSSGSSSTDEELQLQSLQDSDAEVGTRAHHQH